MWIYIPTSVSVAEQEGLTSELDVAQAELLSLSVTLREKSPQPHRWSAILKKERWLMLLSGLTLRLSTSQRGVDKWKESWVATHVNRSQQSGLNWEPPILDTSGRTLRRVSKQLDLFGASLRMSAVIYPWDSPPSQKAYDAWVIRLRQHLLLRRKSAQVINENDYSSWATPLATDAKKKPSGSLARQVDPQSKWSARRATHLDPRTEDGWMSHGDYSHRLLNPNFCEWLMGMDVGSTSLAKTVSGLSETELSLTQRHWPGTNCGMKLDEWENCNGVLQTKTNT